MGSSINRTTSALYHMLILRRHDGQWTFLSPNVKESKTVLDSGFEDGDSGFQLLVPDFFSLEVRFGIPIVSWIPDSLKCIPDSTGKNFPDSGIRIPLHWAILSLTVFFFHFRPRDVTPENWFFQMSSYPRAFGCLIYYFKTSVIWIYLGKLNIQA